MPSACTAPDSLHVYKANKDANGEQKQHPYIHTKYSTPLCSIATEGGRLRPTLPSFGRHAFHTKLRKQSTKINSNNKTLTTEACSTIAALHLQKKGAMKNHNIISRKKRRKRVRVCVPVQEENIRSDIAPLTPKKKGL